MDEPQRYEVDPARLERGRWSAEFNKSVGEGDIAASYSGDTICLRNTTRTPFVFRGDLWVSVCFDGGTARAYRLVSIDEFNKAAMTINEKEASRAPETADADGYFHGVAVSYRKDWFVLCGPPAEFVSGEVVQPGLFGE